MHGSNEVFASIRDYCPLLEELDLQIQNTTDEGLIDFAAGCPKLRIVTFTRCSYITYHGIRALAAGCPNLEEIDFIKCGHILE